MTEQAQASAAVLEREPKVVTGAHSIRGAATQAQPQVLTGNAGPAPLVTVISASGGAGKSTLALTAAYLAARAGIETILLEADLQFGDYGFWLGLDDELSTLSLGAAAQPLLIAEHLTLYKAPCFPEVAEIVSDEVAGLVPKLRTGCELLIADTGAFWSGLTADLIVASDLFWLVCDQRPASVAGAVRASELCGRMGVADVRRVCVYNKWSTRAQLSESQVASALGASRVHCVPDGRDVVDRLLSEGELEELVATDNPIVRGVDALLAETLPRLGRVYTGMPSARRSRWFA